MYKKLIMACMAVAAFAAFVLPASALAVNHPILKDAGGTVAVNSLVKATNFGETVFWNTGATTKMFTCTKAVLTGKVLKNATGTVEGEITKADFSGTGAVHADNSLAECTGSFGNSYFTIKNLPLTVRSNESMAEDELQITGPAAANVKFVFGSTTAGECEWESTSSLKGDFTTGTSAEKDSLFTVRNTQAGSGLKLIRGGFLCPTSVQLGMTFTMETDSEAVAPIWVEP
jgi:hypothetical protein